MLYQKPALLSVFVRGWRTALSWLQAICFESGRRCTISQCDFLLDL